MTIKIHSLDTEADEAHDVCPGSPDGVDARLSGERSRVRVPLGAPSDFVRSLVRDGEEIPEYTMHIATVIPSLSETQRKWVEEAVAAAR